MSPLQSGASMAVRLDLSSDMDKRPPDTHLSGGQNFLVAVVCGAVVANVYFAQPIVDKIAAALGLRPDLAGLIVTLAQLGYCSGLLLVVPLGDIVENRRLSLAALSVGIFAACVMSLTSNTAAFLVASFGLGVGSVSVQILLPFAAALAAPGSQGLAVGRVMAGILTGIMLSRPVSAMVAGGFGWRAVFGLAAATCICSALLIMFGLPPRQPTAKRSYLSTLRSMAVAAYSNRLLQHRASYQFLMFYSYTLFWTAMPLILAKAPFGLTHFEIGLVALAGAAGALMSPVAGRIGDKGLITQGTSAALAAGVVAWAISAFGIVGGVWGISLLVIGALVLDGAVPMSLVLSQRALFAAHPEQRASLNGLFMAAFFVGGAIGATVGVWSVERFSWSGAVLAGAAGPALALLLHVISLARRTPKSTGGA